MIGRIIGLIIVGLIVGALGRLLHPGRDPMPIWLTIVIGIAAALIAGLLIGGILGFILAVVDRGRARRARRRHVRGGRGATV